MDKSQKDASTMVIKRADDLRWHLELLIYQNGGDLFGVADLESAHEFIVAQGGETLGKFPRAVSIGIRLSDAILDQHKPDEPWKTSLYIHHIYGVVSTELDRLAQRVQRELQNSGFKALAIPASTYYDAAKLMGAFSHKLAAHLAGLGWIGKSCLLITPDFGPRLRLVTVLTDAPLAPGTPLNKKCGKCQECIVACPVQAFTGVEFQATEPVEVRFNRSACVDYRGVWGLDEREAKHNHPCGLCVIKCPVGRRT